MWVEAFFPSWLGSIKRKNKKEVDGGKISNEIPVKAIKRLVTSSSKTEHFSVGCRTDEITQESTKETTTTTFSSERRFFERVGPRVGGVG